MCMGERTYVNGCRSRTRGARAKTHLRTHIHVCVKAHLLPHRRARMHIHNKHIYAQPEDTHAQNSAEERLQKNIILFCLIPARQCDDPLCTGGACRSTHARTHALSLSLSLSLETLSNGGRGPLDFQPFLAVMIQRRSWLSLRHLSESILASALSHR